MSDTAKTSQIASKLTTELQNITDELAIKKITLKYWRLMEKTVSPGNFSRCRTVLRKAIQSAFPNTDTATPGYYFTKSGKGQVERFEHLALWYATANQERWRVVGDDARNQYFSQLSTSAETATSTETTASTEQDTPSPTEQDTPTSIDEDTPAPTKQDIPPETKQTFTLQDMKIETLELDADTQIIVESALQNSGLTLAEFLQKACTVYGTTLVGKAKQFTSDLSTVPTDELLKSATYKTHPGRARESIKRSIKAIKIFNSNEPEFKNRWMITQTALQSLTGSKPATVKEIMADYQTDINDYNTGCNFDSPYINRKTGQRIEDVINVAELVPDGLD